MEKLNRSQTLGLFVILALILGVVAFTAVKNGSAPATSGITLHETGASAANHRTDGTSEPTSETSEVVVHVAGAVQKPGVYHLKPEARNVDALQAAGGPTADANTNGVNLAAHVQDGAQLYIPTRSELPAGGMASAAPIVQGGKIGGKSVSKPSKQSGKVDKLTDPSQGLINLNTADAAQLQRIPGIGPSMAERILAYRKESGGFRSPEDLKQISGIGESKFAKMKPFVTVR
ncbi:MAG TPA: ComEA family DNA-binding protein [Chthonomonadaceae bacterium]|nr:ComEA family DNA-binding protein [Chthonomonadaceae bacterium]